MHSLCTEGTVQEAPPVASGGAACPEDRDVVVQVQARFALLGQALVPVADWLRGELKRRVPASGREFEVPKDLLKHIALLERALGHLGPRFTALMSSVVDHDQATALDAGRSVGRLEQVLSELTEGYHEGRRTNTGSSGAEARRLLLGIYRHYLKQISEWLDCVIFATEHPLAEIRRQNLVLHEGMDLSVVLNLKSPPQMTVLLELIQGLGPEGEAPLPAPTMSSDHSPSLLDKARALAFAMGLVSAVSA
jgi:hypothetical protein